jgi:RHS repeat-associated protein
VDQVGNPSAQELQVTTPDGTVHDMVPTGSTYRSIDGTNLTVNSTATQMIDSSGTVYSIPTPQYPIVPASNAYANIWNGSGEYPVTVTNVHGQSWTPTWTTTPIGPIPSDTLGRLWNVQETTDYSGCTGPVAIGDAYIYSLQNQNGNHRPVFKECLVAIPIVTDFGHCHNEDDSPCDYSDMGSQLPGWVQSIVFTPDGTWSSGNAWTFLYGSTDFSSPSYVNYGYLTGIQTPQGGTVTYNVNPLTFGIDGGSNGQVQSRVMNAADGSGNQTTTYTYSLSGSPYTTITNPDSTSVKHEFDPNTSAETSTIYLNQSGSTIETVSKTYEAAGDPFNGYESTYPVYANVFPTSETTTWPDGISCMSSETYSNTYSYSVTFTQTGNPHPPIYSGTAPNGEPATVSTYDCTSGGNPSLLQVAQNVWMDSQSNYYNKNLFGLLQQGSMYDGSNNLTSQLTYGYDQNGEGTVGDQTSISEWINSGGSLQTSTYYDANGQPTKTIDPSDNPTNFGSDPADITVTSTTLPPIPSGVTLTSLSIPDPFTYMITSQTDMAGATSTQSYDWMFRPTSGTLSNTAQYSYTYVSYSGSQLPEIIKTTQIGSGNNATVQTVTDGFGRTIQSNQGTSSESQTGWRQQDTCYDGMGRASFQSYPYITWSATPAAHSCTIAGDSLSYDPLGRLSRTTHQDGTYSTISYTGRATQSTDEMGVSRISQVDGLGRLTIVCEISSTSNMPGSGSPTTCGTDITGTGFVTSYAYNLASHTTTITQGMQQRVFQTDSLGRAVYTSEPERGVTTYAYNYNPTGLQIVRTRPEANQSSSTISTTTTAQYDSIGRVISVSYLNGNSNLYSTSSKTFTYDTLSSPWQSAPLGYSHGRLVFATTGSASAQIANYDALGDAQSTVQCLPDWCGQHSYDIVQTYSYDLRGLQTQEQYMTQGSSGSTISVDTGRSLSGDVLFLSGGQNNVSTLKDPNGNPILLNVTQPGPFGIVTGQYGNNLNVVRQYDALGRTAGGWICQGSSQTYCSGGSQFYGFTGGWSGSYLISSCDTSLNYCSSYGYDQFGRLSSSDIGSGQVVFSYEYDRLGNRWSQTATGSGSSSAPQTSVNFQTSGNLTANNRVIPGTCNPVTASQYCYDAAGNMTADGFHTYTYDAEGNVVGVDGNAGVSGAAQYVYDAFNNRVKEVSENDTILRFAFTLSGQRTSASNSNGNAMTSLSSQRESTWNANGSIATENYYADQVPVAYYSNTDGYIHFQHQDWEGTVRIRSKYNGAFDGSFASFPFGDGYNATGNDSDPLHFALFDYDADSNTDHAEARQYNSTQGRWLSPDPYDGSYDYSNPQSFNRYSYVLNNPLSNIDPSGMECVWQNGSYDAADDRETGDEDKCTERGGTWVDPSLFENSLLTNGQQSNLQYGQWNNQANSTIASSWLTPSSNTNTPDDSPITLNIPMTEWEWAAQQTSPVSQLPWHYGNWAGPGGMGAPIDNADAGAMMHDYCYAHSGSGGALTAGSNFGPFNAALQACNQQLCDTESKIASNINTKYDVHFFWSAGPGEDDPEAYAEWNHEVQDELPAAHQMAAYFTTAPLNGNGCH